MKTHEHNLKSYPASSARARCIRRTKRPCCCNLLDRCTATNPFRPRIFFKISWHLGSWKVRELWDSAMDLPNFPVTHNPMEISQRIFSRRSRNSFELSRRWDMYYVWTYCWILGSHENAKGSRWKPKVDSGTQTPTNLPFSYLFGEPLPMNKIIQTSHGRHSTPSSR